MVAGGAGGAVAGGIVGTDTGGGETFVMGGAGGATTPSLGDGSPGQLSRTRDMASCSACVTHNPYRTLTATWRATYRHRKDSFGGSHVAASPSPFDSLVGPSTASRFSGSLAKTRRVAPLSP